MTTPATPLYYFDHAAATPLDPEVLKAMIPYLSGYSGFGNPSSIYKLGQWARAAVDRSREKIAEIAACKPREVIFTGGGTESNNLFLFGVAQATAGYGGRIKGHAITTKIEHDSVLKPLGELEKRGLEVTYLDVDEDGFISADDVRGALREDTLFVSVIYANNEIGTIQPVGKIAKAVKEWRVAHGGAEAGLARPYFHIDACQASAYLSINIDELGVDAMTINSGKIYGPKGVGSLIVREGVQLMPQVFGGGQEYRIRSGTENVPAIVGFGEAVGLVQRKRENESGRLLKLRDKLIDGIIKNIPDSRLNGSREKRLPNNANVSFKGLEGETILMRLDLLNIAASSGSACTSGSLQPSHVIRALGLAEEWTHSSTRFSLGHGNDDEQINFILEALPGIIKELREISPFC